MALTKRDIFDLLWPIGMILAVLWLALATMGCQFVQIDVVKDDGTTIKGTGIGLFTDVKAAISKQPDGSYSIDWNKLTKAQLAELLGLL